jgi:hypothetical protein
MNAFFDEGERIEDKIKYIGVELPCQRRERRKVWAGWPENWPTCNVCVHGNAKHDPHSHGIEDGMIDVPEQDEETGEE